MSKTPFNPADVYIRFVTERGEEIIGDFSVNCATGLGIDNLVTFPHQTRTPFGSNKSIKPNDYCYWDADLGQWMETDDHFRNRIAPGRLS